MADLITPERAELLTDDELADAQARFSREERQRKVRERSATLIGNVIKANAGKREIEVYLAIGSICPFCPASAKADCAIWVEEVNHLMGESR